VSSYAARRRGLDIWPGFVDALASLLMVLIFVLMIFTLGQFFLTDALGGRDRALAQLNIQVKELAELLSMEQDNAKALETTISQLRASLLAVETERTDLLGERQNLQTQLADQDELLQTQQRTLAELEREIAQMVQLRDQLQAQNQDLEGEMDQTRRELQIQSDVSARSVAQVELLNQQIAALRDQLASVSAALELAETDIKNKQVEIDDLGQRLNLALVDKVQQLAEYRSEFFGRLKQVLGDNPDLRIEGDRFVFQSELLFATGSADLQDGGKAQVRRLANTLSEITRQIPSDLDWVLRVDGHTDRRPIATGQFPSNWELSTARALALVKYLIELGIDPMRLAATGFGEFRPLDTNQNELAYARNRRIELKLTSR